MRENGLEARQKRRFVHTADYAPLAPIAPNVLDRDFDVEAAQQVWVGDVTYIRTAEGWLYLAVLLDLFSRRVVGWATSATNDPQLARARRPALATSTTTAASCTTPTAGAPTPATTTARLATPASSRA